MKKILLTLLCIVILGIVVLLCLCSCYLADKCDEYWDKVKKQMEKKE